MIETTAPLKVADDRIIVEVLGRQKPVITARSDGIEAWCKVFSRVALIPYKQLMDIPEFRAGILAVLTSEASTQADK